MTLHSAMYRYAGTPHLLSSSAIYYSSSSAVLRRIVVVPGAYYSYMSVFGCLCSECTIPFSLSLSHGPAQCAPV